jgi:hypothetical protein
MVSSGLLRRVALVGTDVSEEPGTSFIRVTKIGELGTTKAATSNRRTLRRNSKLIEDLEQQQISQLPIGGKIGETSYAKRLMCLQRDVIPVLPFTDTNGAMQMCYSIN